MAIDLNTLHIAGGGTSGTTVSINDADVRSVGGRVRTASAGNPLDFDWFEESPFEIPDFPTIGNWGEVFTTTVTNPRAFVQFYHDTANDEIKVQYRTTGQTLTTAALSYTVGTGNLLDNLTWQCKYNVSYTITTANDYDEPFDDGYSNNTWYNISTSGYSPQFNWEVHTSNGELAGNVTFYIRVLKTSDALPSGLYLPTDNGFTSESEDFDIYRSLGGGGGGGGGEEP